jgi:hypothetical protein
MNHQQLDHPTFHSVARQIVRRLFLRHWLETLGRTAPIVFSIAAVLAVVAWFYGLATWIGWVALPLIPFWILLAAGWSWLHRPSPATALAYWDETAGRQEMFLSAYCFETAPRADSGEQLHLFQAARRLQSDIGSLAADLPLPVPHRAWAVPLAFVAVVGLLLVPRSVANGPGVDPQSKQRAREVAEALKEQMQAPDEVDGLTPEEQEQLQELEQSIEDAAEQLKELDEESQRDVLAELEEQAHAAQLLAAALEATSEQQLSSKMLEELARHADTTKFATALQAMDLQQGSQEAEVLSQRLDDDDLAMEPQQRIETALDKSLEVATEQDKAGPVGTKLDQANQELAKDQPKEAAKRFKELADQLAQAHQRQLVQQRLEQLAQQLRDSGQQIFGQSPTDIRRLAQNLDQQGLQQLGSQQLQSLGNLPLDQPLDNLLPEQLGAPTSGAPLAAGPLPIATGQIPIPGNMPGDFGAPMFGVGQAPVPGTGTGQGMGQGLGQGLGQGQGAGLGVGLGAAPVPGAGAGDGGHFAGVGSAGYGNQATRPLDPTATDTVNAPITGQGPSQLRDVEPQARREQMARSSQQLAIDFIKTEEEALADEPLPLSRREQVLRYFTALRRRLVEPESAEPVEP